MKDNVQINEGVNPPRTSQPNKSVKGGANPPKTTQPKGPKGK